jgi:hypothetical protein
MESSVSAVFNSLREVNKYKRLKNKNEKEEKLNLSKRGNIRGTHTHHHLNRTTEGEEGITRSTSRS